jgi:phage baseplate assembly protein W
VSYSFALNNGDLNPIGQGGVAVVTGIDKLKQDLRNWILEPVGTDPLHLDFGSNLDGGMSPTGQIIPSMIGSTNSADVALQVESEIRRVVYAYQQQQAARLVQDQQDFAGKNTFSPGEILYSLDTVTTTIIGDVLLVSLAITASDGQSLQFNIPVST